MSQASTRCVSRTAFENLGKQGLQQSGKYRVNSDHVTSTGKEKNPGEAFFSRRAGGSLLCQLRTATGAMWRNAQIRLSSPRLTDRRKAPIPHDSVTSLRLRGEVGYTASALVSGEGAPRTSVTSESVWMSRRHPQSRLTQGAPAFQHWVDPCGGIRPPHPGVLASLEGSDLSPQAAIRPHISKTGKLFFNGLAGRLLRGGRQVSSRIGSR